MIIRGKAKKLLLLEKNHTPFEEYLEEIAFLLVILHYFYYELDQESASDVRSYSSSQIE
jgi:hypothetical protein